MEYNEEEFKVKANSKARTVWMILDEKIGGMGDVTQSII